MAATNQDPPTLSEFQGHEIYPMPMFATLEVADVASTSAWYQAALGFDVVFAAPGAALVHLRRRKYQDVLLVPARGTAATPPTTLTLSFNADRELHALWERARIAAPLGASEISDPVKTPWNTIDLRVTDPSGHRLIFTARDPAPDPDQAARITAMFEKARVDL
jgi:uncharacterized glyoxalase superfamily protein PhnB